MPAVWFCLVAAMLAIYVVLDGLDLGAAVAGRLLARNAAERRAVLASIGPVWDGNEVWLVAGGGTLFFAFPALYAAAFSGLYLPLMVALWLLIGRGVSIELRHHLDGAIWHALWDAAFFVSSLLLCVVFGVALGNVVRGVPFTAGGEFFLPLWGDAGQAVRSGIFDGYTLLVGVAALAALALHGALWLALKLPGELETRARRLAGRLLWTAAAAAVLVGAASLRVQPLLSEHLAARPWGAAAPLVALAGLAAAAWCLRRGALAAALLGSSAFLVGMLGAAACGLYPYALPGLQGGGPGLTVEAAAAPAYGLRVGLWWWVPGMLLAVAYSVHMYRSFGGKVAIAGAPGAEEAEAGVEGAAGY